MAFVVTERITSLEDQARAILRGRGEMVIDLDLFMAAHVLGLRRLLGKMLRAAGADACMVPEEVITEMREEEAKLTALYPEG